MICSQNHIDLYTFESNHHSVFCIFKRFDLLSEEKNQSLIAALQNRHCYFASFTPTYIVPLFSIQILFSPPLLLLLSFFAFVDIRYMQTWLFLLVHILTSKWHRTVLVISFFTVYLFDLQQFKVLYEMLLDASYEAFGEHSVRYWRNNCRENARATYEYWLTTNEISDSYEKKVHWYFILCVKYRNNHGPPHISNIYCSSFFSINALSQLNCSFRQNL